MGNNEEILEEQCVILVFDQAKRKTRSAFDSAAENRHFLRRKAEAEKRKIHNNRVVTEFKAKGRR